MKSKKLFAILTLVAFLMTLVPMAAFAIGGDAAVRQSSKVSVDKTSLDADGEAMAKFTVYLFDSTNAKAADQVVYVASDRPDNIDVFYQKDGETPLVEQVPYDNVFVTPLSAGSKVEFKVTSCVAGTAKIAIGLATPDGPATNIYNYVADEDDSATATKVGLIKTTELTFKAGGVDEVVIDGIYEKGDADLVSPLPQKDDPDAADGFTQVANGGDYYRIYFQVQNAANAGIADEKVTFSVNKSGATLSATSDETDAQGMVDVKVYATKSGTYKIKASAGGEDVEAVVYFNGGEVDTITLSSDNNQKIALDQEDKKFTFIIKDAQGNEIKFDDVDDVDGTDGDGAIETVEVVTEPTDSDIETSIGFDFNDDGQARIIIPEFSEEGAYKIRVELNNGKSTTVDFTVKDQGDITAITIEYDEAVLPLEAKTAKPTITRLDADGVGLEIVSTDSDFEYFSSDTDYATVDVGGVVYAGDDDDYLGPVTITVVDKDEKVTGSTTLEIANYAKKLIFDVPATTAPGETATVTVKVTDKNGKVVSLGSGTAVTPGAWIISSPADSSKAYDIDEDFEEDMQETGAAKIDVDCDKAGTVKLQVKVNDMTATASVVFAAPAPPKVVIGAKAITMFVGATGYVQDGVAKVLPNAPFIEAATSRTFVPFRAIGEALGATCDWNEATQTVTLTRSDMTLTLVIGGTTITKVADGVTTAVTIDAPAQIVNGSTFVPLRAIGESFGAAVAFENGAVSITQ